MRRSDPKCTDKAAARDSGEEVTVNRETGMKPRHVRYHCKDVKQWNQECICGCYHSLWEVRIGLIVETGLIQ